MPKQQGHGKYRHIIERCKSLAPIATAVAHPCGASSLRGALEVAREGLITPLLVGLNKRIESVASEHGLGLSGLEIVDAAFSQDSAAKAVELVRAGRAPRR